MEWVVVFEGWRERSKVMQKPPVESTNKGMHMFDLWKAQKNVTKKKSLSDATYMSY